MKDLFYGCLIGIGVLLLVLGLMVLCTWIFSNAFPMLPIVVGVFKLMAGEPRRTKSGSIDKRFTSEKYKAAASSGWSYIILGLVTIFLARAVFHIEHSLIGWDFNIAQ